MNVIDLLLDAVCVVDERNNLVYASAACEQIFGYTPEEMVGRNILDMVHPDDLSKTRESAVEVMAGRLHKHFENRYIRKNGEVVHVMWSARRADQHGLRVGVARDITERKQAEQKQAALYAISEAAYWAGGLPELFTGIHQIVSGLLPADNFFVALYDKDRDELSFPYYVDQHDHHPAPRPLDSGTLSAEVIRTGRSMLLTPDNRDELLARISGATDAIDGTDSLDWLGVPLMSPAGAFGAIVVQSYASNVRYSEKNRELMEYVSAQIAAAIERRQMQTRLEHLAQHDQLTDLPNRQLFNDRLVTAMSRARRDQSRVGLLYLDLDKFKEINDTHGHAVGDRMLGEVARRLGASVRASDTVARLGGDEFVVLLHDIREPEQALAVAEKIHAELGRPFQYDQLPLAILPSMGLVLFPDHGVDETALLINADKAMYEAKRKGGNQLFMPASGAPMPATESSQTARS